MITVYLSDADWHHRDRILADCEESIERVSTLNGEQVVIEPSDTTSVDYDGPNESDMLAHIWNGSVLRITRGETDD